jgi:hypothetical protein
MYKSTDVLRHKPCALNVMSSKLHCLDWYNELRIGRNVQLISRDPLYGVITSSSVELLTKSQSDLVTRESAKD